ncbi:ATP-dependent nuclease [Rhodanobacter hydrolyticus]|uniref:AAA family ATPase n=1 Tax=Rhodanobacter hydrolyticus TaxID=2250595 RepID=A0ABW8J440_9GAMM
MRVADLDIQNFRGVRQGHIRFKKHAVLVGSNNAGKTTIIEALTLLLGRDRLIRDLTEHDFHGSNPQPADRIRLVATITDFPGDDPALNIDWFRDGRAVPKWLDEVTGKVNPTRDEPAWKLCCQIGSQAYFDRDTLTVETVRYFHDHDNPIDPFVEDSPVAVPSKLIQDFGFFLVRASRTWDRILSWGSELFRRTVEAAAAQPSEAVLAQRDRLRNPESAIEKDPQIAPLIASVNAEVARCIPSAPTLRLRVTNTDSRSVLDAVAPHFGVEGGNDVPVSRQGNGLISLQGLLLLLELGRLRSQAGDGFIMALEEPELHLPPATQQQLVLRVQSLSSQTFTTTHSPLIASLADPTSVMMVRNTDGQLTAEPFLLAPLQHDAPNWLRKFFQHSRTDVLAALMHPFVLITEGRSDYHLIKAILKPLMLTQGWTDLATQIFALEVGVAPTEDAQVLETSNRLHRLHPNVCCLVDGDDAGIGYAKALHGSKTPPSAVIRWTDGTTIEDAVSWILNGEQNTITALLGELPNLPSKDLGGIVARLKDKKNDIVLYEAIADAIASSAACRQRASDLFAALAKACSNQSSDRFKQAGDKTWVFQQ